MTVGTSLHLSLTFNPLSFVPPFPQGVFYMPCALSYSPQEIPEHTHFEPLKRLADRAFIDIRFG